MELFEARRELNCLFETTKELWVTPQSLEAALAHIPHILRDGLSYPDTAIVHIHLRGKTFTTEMNDECAVENETVETIVANGQKVGWIAVGYRSNDEGRQLLPLEKVLVQEIAVRIGARLRLQDATEELHRSRERYRQTVDMHPDLIFRIDKASSRITFANRSLAGFLGCDCDDLNGKQLMEVFPEQDWPPSLKPPFARGFHPPETPRNGRLRRRDGKIRHVSWKVVQVPSDREDLDEYQFIGRDITSTILADQVIKDSRRQEKLRINERLRLHQFSLSRVVAMGFAHQLSQPLAVIGTLIGHCRMLMEKEGFDRNKIISNLDRSIKQVQFAASLAHSFVSQSINKEHAVEPVKLNDIVVDSLQYLESSGELDNIKLILNVESEAALENVDRREVEQLLIALIGNACDASRSRSNEVEALVTIESFSNDAFASIAISDNGDGIDLSNLENLCKPFVSGKSHTLGMGLPIARMIVDGWGGSLQFKHRANGGTTVTVRIPLKT
ncbi:MAG: PAS domain-containing sensor histidine kinase [Alphaproteobacteria bacterium]|nr:PAS domain-containing sensor histidine kinase [Alphaproteobacteria bacterium]